MASNYQFSLFAYSRIRSRLSQFLLKHWYRRANWSLLAHRKVLFASKCKDQDTSRDLFYCFDSAHIVPSFQNSGKMGTQILYATRRCSWNWLWLFLEETWLLVLEKISRPTYQTRRSINFLNGLLKDWGVRGMANICVLPENVDSHLWFRINAVYCLLVQHNGTLSGPARRPRVRSFVVGYELTVWRNSAVPLVCCCWYIYLPLYIAHDESNYYSLLQSIQ